MIMPKVENPLTGKKTDLFNWKSVIALIGGAILLLVVFKVGSWGLNKISGVVGTPQQGSTLNDVLGGI